MEFILKLVAIIVFVLIAVPVALILNVVDGLLQSDSWGQRFHRWGALGAKEGEKPGLSTPRRWSTLDSNKSAFGRLTGEPKKSPS